MRNLLPLLFLFTTPALAQDAPVPATEIVYRTNLGRADDVKLLISQGASPDQKDESGTPLLALAAARDDSEGQDILKLLIESGADINIRDAKGQTALFYAARKANKPAIMLLLENKIDYYAADAAGDIARTIAYRAGHNDVVTMLDDFVKHESEKVTAQYNELNRSLEEQYTSQQENEKKAAGDAAREALEKTQQMKEERVSMEKEIAEKRASKESLQGQHDLAFHACAFQYWSYCDAAKQTSELKGEALARAIDSHAEQIITLRDMLESNYEIQHKVTGKIIDMAQQSVNNQILAMPSKTYRFQQGVCRMQDMTKRCNEISQYPGHLTTPAPKKPVSNGDAGSNRRR